MTRSRRPAVARYHDRVAHRYDDIYDDLYWHWHDALTWDYLKPHLPERLSAPILDLGCGTGKWGVKIAQSGYCVTCLDISGKMVETTRRKVAELGLEHKITCLQADIADLSALDRDCFELAVAFGEPLCSTPSAPRALKEICRIVRPGGRLCATVDNRLNVIEYYLEKGDLAGLDRLLKDGRTHWLTRDHAEQFELHTFTPRQCGTLLERAGFELLETRGKTVLPLRRYRELLEDKAGFRKLLAIEKKLSRDTDAIGRAAHLQFTARKP